MRQPAARLQASEGAFAGKLKPYSEIPTSARIPRSASTSLGIIKRSAVARSRGNSVKRLHPGDTPGT